MHLIDWTIVVGLLVFLTAVAYSTKKYTRSVADFLVANRCAGRYLLTMSDGVASVGAITLIAHFEKFYQAGFAAAWWGSMLLPLSLILALSGWVTYRYRETRALTMAQFFEMRYSRNFRVFTGMLAWFSGLINYAIFPAVTARFFIFFCNIPQYFISVGSLELNVTMGIVMFVFLGIALSFTLMGGQIAAMITDFIQGQLLNIGFLILMIVLLVKFGWPDIVEILRQAPEGKSLLNPFKQGKIPDFHVGFFIMQAFIVVYGYKAWQGNQGYNAAAKSPHEAKMAGVLSGWRSGVSYMTMILIPVCCYVLLHSSLYPEQTQAAQTILAEIKNEYIRQQVTVPVALTQILPVGLVGLFTAIIIAAAISTDDTYMHSWGSIFIQDVVVPLRKKKLSQEMHLRLLRYSITGVAVFAWLFSMLFTINDYIFMYLTITGAIFLGGAGSAIIFGLYWKRGTTAGAWAGMCVGSVLAVTGMVFKNILWPMVSDLQETYTQWQWLQSLPVDFPFNGMEMSFGIALIAMASYLLISLMTKPDPNFDMDRLLHRHKYEIEGEHSQVGKAKRGWKALGITSEFTTGDKTIYFLKIAWTLLWFGIFVIGTIYNLTAGAASDDAWANYWLFYIVLSAFVGIVTTVWFLWGGFRDLADLYKTLRTAKRNELDDGTVLK